MSATTLTDSPAPYPPPHEFEAHLAEALAKRDISELLMAVKQFAVEMPPPERPLRAPAPGLDAAFEGRLGDEIPAEKVTSWFHMLLYNAGNVCLRAEEPQLAIALYKQGLVEYSHPSILNNIGAALKRMGRMEEAVIWYLRATAEDPSYHRGYLRAAATAALHQIPSADPLGYLKTAVANGATEADILEYIAQAPPEESAAMTELLRQLKGRGLL